MSFDPTPPATAPPPAQAPWVFAILNAQSGTCTIADVRQELAVHFGGIQLRIHELQAGEDLGAVVAGAIADGCRHMVAGGGDGTISAVASFLVGSGVQLAILPLGTANVLARELNIPTDLGDACRLAASPLLEEGAEATISTSLKIDAMKIDGRHYLTQVGVGIDALMIQSTSSAAKRRLGKLAYLISAAKHILAFKPHRFVVVVDGATRKLKASQILVANTGMMGQPPLRWGPGIRPDDGRLNACFIRSAGLRDYMRLFWVVFRGHQEKIPHMRHQEFDRSMAIRSRHPLPVQADGEIIAETPITIEVVRQALSVVVPTSGNFAWRAAPEVVPSVE